MALTTALLISPPKASLAEVNEEVKVTVRTFPKCQVFLAEGAGMRPLGPSNEPIWIKAPVFIDANRRPSQYASGTLILQAPGHDDQQVMISNQQWTTGSLPPTGKYQLPAKTTLILLQDYCVEYPLAFSLLALGGLASVAGTIYWRRDSRNKQANLTQLNRQLNTVGDPLIGKKLGSFEVVSRVGQGGMGSVYRVVDEAGDYAAKVIYYDQIDSIHLDRFRREFKLMSQLRHSTFPKSFDYGETPGMAYCIMELCKGETLRAHVQAGGLPWSRIRPWLLTLLEGLEFAHSQGIVHRDLKPENLMIDGDLVRILDFGLARSANITAITMTGQALGTPAYIAPEQIHGTGNAADPRTDLYSFGIILYELLTGRPPFTDDEVEKLVAHHLQTIPAPLSQRLPNCPPELELAVATLLSKKPSSRYSSAKEVRDILSAIDPSFSERCLHSSAPDDLTQEQNTIVVARKPNAET